MTLVLHVEAYDLNLKIYPQLLLSQLGICIDNFVIACMPCDPILRYALDQNFISDLGHDVWHNPRCNCHLSLISHSHVIIQIEWVPQPSMYGRWCTSLVSCLLKNKNVTFWDYLSKAFHPFSMGNLYNSNFQLVLALVPWVAKPLLLYFISLHSFCLLYESSILTDEVLRLVGRWECSRVSWHVFA